MIRFSPETASTRNCLKWWWWRALIGVVMFWFMLIIFMPLSTVIIMKFDADSLPRMKQYLSWVLNGHWSEPFDHYWYWLKSYMFHEPRHFSWYSFFHWRILIVPTFIFLAYEFLLMNYNPFHLFPQPFGTGHNATEKEIEEMGLFDGKHLLLGVFNGRKLRLPDTRSVFCIGAPGAGKTMGVIIPAILEEKTATVIAHDPKGEIAKYSSGYRATLGPVYKMNWLGRDDPEHNIRWPSWNPIGGGNLPPLNAGREGYIDGLVSFLIPDGPSGTDPYWVKTGRGCLTGLTGYLCGKVDQAQANDYFLSRIRENALDDEDYDVLTSFYESMRDFPEVLQAKENAQNHAITADNYLPVGSWDLIPAGWHGHDACFAMLLDLLNTAQIQANLEIAERQKNQDPAALNLDAWQMIFEKVVLETAYYGYGRRTLLELNQVLSLPDKQRGSVMSMALSGVNIFKNSAVRCRTSMNDFNYEQLRGVKDEATGEYKPVTIYMSVPYEDLKSSVLLSTLFINMATQYLMEFGPNQGKAGPCSVSFMLDEFQHMPSLESITDGIIFGRAKQNKFLVSVQDWHQISSKYSQETADIIMSSAAVKIIKRLNNPEARKPLMGGLPTYTRLIRSYSYDHTWFIDFSGPLLPNSKTKAGYNLYFPVKRKYKTDKDSVVSGTSLLKMSPKNQLVIYSGHTDHPINTANTPFCDSYPEYKPLTAMKPAPALPDDVIREIDDVNTVSQMHISVVSSS